MKERLLICTGCGEEYWFDQELLDDWLASSRECLSCGEVEHHDYGWVEVEQVTG